MRTAPTHTRMSSTRSGPRTLGTRLAATGAAAVLAATGLLTTAHLSADAGRSSPAAFVDPVPLFPLPLPCTGSPLDGQSTCAGGGHYGKGGDRGDGVGSDTPSFGGGGSGGDTGGDTGGEGAPPA